MLARVRVLIVVLVLALAILPLAGCGGEGDVATDGEAASGNGEAAEPAITPQNADELAAYLQDSYGAEEWMSDFTGVEFTTSLSRPVVQINFEGSRDEVSVFKDEVMDLFYYDEIAVDAVVEVWSDEGWTVASSFGTMPELGPLPAPPANEGEVIGYLKAAYGPEGTRPTNERWVGMLQGASILTDNEGLRILKIATNLDSVDDAKEYEQAGLIMDALNEAGISGWADRISIDFSSGFVTTNAVDDWSAPYDW